MIQTIAEVKGWTVEEDWVEELREEDWGVVQRLEENWKAFKAGNHPAMISKRGKKKKNEATIREASEFD
jgi:hypothetical protein